MTQKNQAIPDAKFKLTPNPNNPRTITLEKKKMLKASMEAFGDLGGVVFNIRSQQLAGGHQRVVTMEEHDAALITITQRYDVPTKTGTIAEGYIEYLGERYSYRAVDWDENTEKAANLAANKGAGNWHDELLGQWMRDLDKSNFNLDLTMFDIDERVNLVSQIDELQNNPEDPEDEDFDDLVDDDDGDDEKENFPEDIIPDKIEPRVKQGQCYTIAGHTLFNGDCLEVLKTLQSNSIDSLVTDPPAGIAFMGKEWDEDKGGSKQWTAWLSGVMKECLRVMKPGAHGLVWALPRTSHWTATACEDAGFEVRDVVTHLFGSGFPKSLDISKAIDKSAGAGREVVGENKNKREAHVKGGRGFDKDLGGEKLTSMSITAPSTHEAKQWEGWGTALKPASEHWILIRKPIEEDTVAKNVLKHGTGGINIDASRIGVDATDPNHRKATGENGNADSMFGVGNSTRPATLTAGRFPANLILSHNPDCVEVGVKRVKASAPSGRPSRGQTPPMGTTFHKPNNTEVVHHGSEDGTETVSAFNCHPKLSSALFDAVLCDPQVTSIQGSQDDYQFYRDFYDELLRLVSAYGLDVFPSGNDALSLCNLYLSLVPHILESPSFCLLSNLGDFFQHCIEDDILKNSTIDRVCRDRTLSGKLCSSYKAKFLRRSNNISESKMVLDDNHEKSNHIACSPDQLKTLCSLKTYLASALITQICQVAELDRQSGVLKSGGFNEGQIVQARETHAKGAEKERIKSARQPSTGGASRFFYCAKPSKREKNAGLEEREGQKVNDGRDTPIDNAFQRGETDRLNIHPTVKSTKLMSYLINMVTPPDGIILDCFGGSGTTMIAAHMCHFDSILIEQSTEYCDIILARAEYMTEKSAQLLDNKDGI